MEFDGTTFALEVINFLVLVWLLHRLLYKPVSAAIKARQAGIDQTLADARALRTEAEWLKRQFDDRMSDWEKERALTRQQLQREMEVERARQLAALGAALDAERERRLVLDEQRAREQQQRLAQDARAEGGRFVARLLSRFASPDLDDRVCQMLLEDLPELPERERQALRAAGQAGEAKVTSAYPLKESERAGLSEALAALAGRRVSCEFVSDPSLLAGLRVSIGAWVLRYSLRDEMQFFMDARRDAG